MFFFTVLSLMAFNVLAQEVGKDDELKVSNPYIRIEPAEVNSVRYRLICYRRFGATLKSAYIMMGTSPD